MDGSKVVDVWRVVNVVGDLVQVRLHVVLVVVSVRRNIDLVRAEPSLNDIAAKDNDQEKKKKVSNVCRLLRYQRRSLLIGHDGFLQLLNERRWKKESDSIYPPTCACSSARFVVSR